ncbi:MAG: hypothetical protein EPO63_03170 [Candidatus Nitrosotenuis sp.]|nr:MAG: hypothetical protein EPO63_03170 [Candidatus Nitrosotenuis sp.]
MTAIRKITEAETILNRLGTNAEEFQSDLSLFVKTIQEIFTNLLEEYNTKFDFKLKHMSLGKFKKTARNLGRLDAINFLIWYEKEYRKIKDDTMFDFLFGDNTEQGVILEKGEDVKRTCSLLLDRIRQMTYYAYENF